MEMEKVKEQRMKISSHGNLKLHSSQQGGRVEDYGSHNGAWQPDKDR